MARGAFEDRRPGRHLVKVASNLAHGLQVLAEDRFQVPFLDAARELLDPLR